MFLYVLFWKFDACLKGVWEGGGREREQEEGRHASLFANFAYALIFALSKFQSNGFPFALSHMKHNWRPRAETKPDREGRIERKRVRETCAIKRRQINNLNSKKSCQLCLCCLAWNSCCGFYGFSLRFLLFYFRLLIITSTCCEFKSSFMLTMASLLKQQCQSVYCLSCQVPLKSVFVICYVR